MSTLICIKTLTPFSALLYYDFKFGSKIVTKSMIGTKIVCKAEIKAFGIFSVTKGLFCKLEIYTILRYFYEKLRLFVGNRVK